MFAFLANAFFGGNYTDSLNESRIISRKAFDELNFDAMKMNSTQQLTIRGFKKRQKMAEIVDNQNKNDTKYIPMSKTFNTIAFNTAKELIFEGAKEPSGYTEPILHKRRLEIKSHK